MTNRMKTSSAPSSKVDTALSAALSKLQALRPCGDAFKIGGSISASHEYAYFADETQSYWLVTRASLERLADMDYDAWAEADKTAVEYGRKRPAEAR